LSGGHSTPEAHSPQLKANFFCMSPLNAYQSIQPGADELVAHIEYRQSPQAGEEHVRNKTITGLFEAKVKQRPDRVALECRNSEVTYRELNKRSNQLAYYLKRKYDIGRGDIVAIMMQRSEWLLTAILGVLKSGAAYLPIDTACENDQCEHMLADSKVKLVLSDIDGAPGFPLLELRRQWPTISTITDRRPQCEHEPGDIACILYAGEPLIKTQIAHHSIVKTLTGFEKMINVTAKDKLLAVTTHPFDIWIMEFFLPLICGAQVLLATAEEARDPDLLLMLMQEKDPTIIQATSLLWDRLQQSGLDAAENLRIIYRPAEAIFWCRCKTR
jgi:non-ribosomal peptide synthetase component F